MSKIQDTYFMTADLESVGGTDAHKAALNRAHSIRQFEIDLYWKRANYFWLLQAAVFAAIGFTWKGDTNAPNILPVGLACLGVVTAVAGYLASHGSKFWQRNWEHHIDMLETKFEGSLYKIVYVSPSGPKWSLTGLSETLGASFITFWVLVLLAATLRVNPSWNLDYHQISSPTVIELQTVACWVFAGFWSFKLMQQKSGITGDRVNYTSEPEESDDQQATSEFPRKRAATSYLIRREPSIK